MKHTLVGGAIFFLCTGVVTSTQAQEPQKVIPEPHVRIELTIDKKVYGRRESVRFKASLKNIDPRGFYISKSFYEAGGGIAGFYVYGTQLSGKKGGVTCEAGYGDSFRFSESRSPEQILKEDFLPLRPGGFVGYEGTYQPCVISNPGEYEIWVEYVTWDLSQGLVRPLVFNRQRVLDGTFKSRPVKFWIQ
jgi:hypothetical protein